MKKKYTRDQIRNLYNGSTKNRRIEILHDALDYMQHYNGRTKLDCIALAMGFDSDDGKTFFKVKE